MSESTFETDDTTAHIAGRSGHSWLTWLCGTLLLPAAGLAAAEPDTDRREHPDGTTASCSAYIPLEARIVDSFRLCQSDPEGANTLYACVHFVSAKGNYRVLFRGGCHPEVIARLTTIGEVNELSWHKAKGSNQLTDLPITGRPPTVSGGSTRAYCTAQSNGSFLRSGGSRPRGPPQSANCGLSGHVGDCTPHPESRHDN